VLAYTAERLIAGFTTSPQHLPANDENTSKTLAKMNNLAIAVVSVSRRTIPHNQKLDISVCFSQ